MSSSPRKRPPPLPEIDPARCTGCGWCIGACPPHVLSLQLQPDWRKRSTLDDAAGCTGCAKCAVRCPFGAIRMRQPDRPDKGNGPHDGGPLDLIVEDGHVSGTSP
jgi:ferredoxin